MIRRGLAAAGLAAFLAVAGAFPAAAGELAVAWPGKDVTLVLPFAPGNESDMYAALLQESFAETTRWALKIRHAPGEAGAQAWARMIDDAPDGYTLTGVNIPHVILRGLQPDSEVKPEAMRICHISAYTPCVLWAPKQGAFASLDAFLAASRKNPGGILVAGPGRYSAGQLAARMLDRSAGVRSAYIPYAGTGEAANAVRDGKAALFWAHTAVLPSFGDDFRPLAVAADKRHPALPGVPTFRELGYDFTQGVYRGLAVPENTPEETCRSIGALFYALNASAVVRVKAGIRGFTPVNIPYEGIPAFFTEQIRKYRDLAEEYQLTDQ